MIQAAAMDKLPDYEQLYNQLREKCAAQEALIAELKSERNGKAPLNNTGYEYLTNLQYKVKSLTFQVNAFKSEQKYIDMKAGYKALLAEKDNEIKKLKRELADARRQTVHVREIWQQMVDDLEEGHAKELLKKGRETKALEGKLLETQIRLDAEKEKFRDKARELYQARTELEDEKGRNQRLKILLNQDFENSSKPSSQKYGPKKITNNREKTGKKPGGQPGHKGHLRKKHAPANKIYIPAPEKYAENPGYRLTGKIITKQMVDIRVGISVDEYYTPEYRNILTGQRVHAGFPDGVVNDVNYSGAIKAFAFLLNNRCNVSVANVSDFISELSHGGLNISTGMINGLSREFSLKTEAEQKKAFADILRSPVVNTDLASVRVNGQNVNVAVCATPMTTMYFAREHKGHEGVKGTPVEEYQGILVHDHDPTFHNYGSAHQECLEHILRYLKDSIDNEPNLKWNLKMRDLIRGMIHFRNSLDPDSDKDPDEADPDKVSGFEALYDKILDIAKDEYEYEPPSKYYMEGFNLYKRLFNYKACHLLFLHDRRVPHTNNLSERLLRAIKRKSKQVMTFRSFGGLHYLCESMGTVSSLRAQSQNLYDSVASIFNRSKSICGKPMS